MFYNPNINFFDPSNQQHVFINNDFNNQNYTHQNTFNYNQNDYQYPTMLDFQNEINNNFYQYQDNNSTHFDSFQPKTIQTLPVNNNFKYAFNRESFCMDYDSEDNLSELSLKSDSKICYPLRKITKKINENSGFYFNDTINSKCFHGDQISDSQNSIRPSKGFYPWRERQTSESQKVKRFVFFYDRNVGQAHNEVAYNKLFYGETFKRSRNLKNKTSYDSHTRRSKSSLPLTEKFIPPLPKFASNIKDKRERLVDKFTQSNLSSSSSSNKELLVSKNAPPPAPPIPPPLLPPKVDIFAGIRSLKNKRKDNESPEDKLKSKSFDAVVDELKSKLNKIRTCNEEQVKLDAILQKIPKKIENLTEPTINPLSGKNELKSNKILNNNSNNQQIISKQNNLENFLMIEKSKLKPMDNLNQVITKKDSIGKNKIHFQTKESNKIEPINNKFQNSIIQEKKIDIIKNNEGLIYLTKADLTKVQNKKEERTKTWLETSSSESSLLSSISYEPANESQIKKDNDYYKLEILNENDHSDYEGKFTRINFKPIYENLVGKGLIENKHTGYQDITIKSNPKNINTKKLSQKNKIQKKMITAFSTRNLFKMPHKFSHTELNEKFDESYLKFNDKNLEFSYGNKKIENDYNDLYKQNYNGPEILQTEEMKDFKNYWFDEINFRSAINNSNKFELSNASKLIPSKNSPFTSYRKHLSDNHLEDINESFYSNLDESDLNNSKIWNINFENLITFDDIEKYNQFCHSIGINDEMILNEIRYQDIENNDKYYLETNNEQEYEKFIDSCLKIS